jgi:hypothetical protein
VYFTALLPGRHCDTAARPQAKQHRIKHDFAFSGFVRCGHCGCYFVDELKKQRYVYYHCTGHRGKCPEPYTREEAMQDQLADSLRALVIPRGVLNWLQEAIGKSDLTERATRDRETKRLERAASPDRFQIWKRCTRTGWKAGSLPKCTTGKRANSGSKRLSYPAGSMKFKPAHPRPSKMQSI